MVGHDRILSIELSGPSISERRISVDNLIQVLQALNKVLYRTSIVLQGRADSRTPGAPSTAIKEQIALDLVDYSSSSPSVILGFERTFRYPDLPTLEIDDEVLETSVDGLAHVQTTADYFPKGFDVGVLLAWKKFGKIFSHGINNVEFRIPKRPQSKIVAYTPEGYSEIQRKLLGPTLSQREIEGRLLMADFKEHGTRCRIHPPQGEPIICLFDQQHQEAVFENILRYVRVIGSSSEDPYTGKISSITISDIEPIADKEDEQQELLPQGAPLPSGFWNELSIEELAAAQGIECIADATGLLGTWPGDVNDNFEQFIEELRKSDANSNDA